MQYIYGVPFVSKRMFQQMCSKEQVFTKYQWNNDGFYSSKTVIFGNIDEQSVFTKHRLFIGAQQQDKCFVNINRCLANIDSNINGIDV